MKNNVKSFFEHVTGYHGSFNIFDGGNVEWKISPRDTFIIVGFTYYTTIDFIPRDVVEWSMNSLISHITNCMTNTEDEDDVFDVVVILSTFEFIYCVDDYRAEISLSRLVTEPCHVPELTVADLVIDCAYYTIYEKFIPRFSDDFREKMLLAFKNFHIMVDFVTKLMFENPHDGDRYVDSMRVKEVSLLVIFHRGSGDNIVLPNFTYQYKPPARLRAYQIHELNEHVLRLL